MRELRRKDRVAVDNNERTLDIRIAKLESKAALVRANQRSARRRMI